MFIIFIVYIKSKALDPLRVKIFIALHIDMKGIYEVEVCAEKIYDKRLFQIIFPSNVKKKLYIK